MYNRSQHKTKAIGYLHLFLAALSIIYLIVSLFVPSESLTNEQIIQQKYSRYALLFCIVVDIIIGTYIQTVKDKMLLFFQALATMLLFSAHIFFVYAYFTVNGTGLIDTETALDIAMIFIVITALLHAINLWPTSHDEDNSKNKINVSDDLFEDINIYDE